MLLQDTYQDVKTSILALHQQGKGGDKGVHFESMCNLKKTFFSHWFCCVNINVFAEEYQKSVTEHKLNDVLLADSI